MGVDLEPGNYTCHDSRLLHAERSLELWLVMLLHCIATDI